MMISLAALAIFSGLSLNLLLSFALGAAGIAGDRLPKGQSARALPVCQLGFLFIAVLFLWVVFTYVFPPHWRGFSEYFLFFPLSALICLGLELFREQVLQRFIPKLGAAKKVFSALTAYDGLVPASLIITITVAGSFLSAFIITLFFALGNLLAMLILNEIRRKSTLEWAPRFLRGSPLILISMGLLSLIFASAAGLFFKLLEVF